MELMVTGLEMSLIVNVSDNNYGTCTHTHSPSSLFLAAISCGPLSVTANAPGGLTLQFSIPTTSVGTRAVYSCNSSGYQVVGNAQRVCGVDGNWSGVEPQCQC